MSVFFICHAGEYQYLIFLHEIPDQARYDRFFIDLIFMQILLECFLGSWLGLC